MDVAYTILLATISAGILLLGGRVEALRQEIAKQAAATRTAMLRGIRQVTLNVEDIEPQPENVLTEPAGVWGQEGSPKC